MFEQRKRRRDKFRAAYIYAALALMLAAVAGIGLFGSVVASTSTTEFCISCHEMASTVYEEYKTSRHYRNSAGVQASCSDCHVPRQWDQVLVRKLMAVKDLYHHLLGTVDTVEKFEARRLQMAERVWANMRANDSRECRNCHDFKAMDLTQQRRRAMKQHENARDQNKTCIDCHQGIAHKAVHNKENSLDDEQEINLEF